MAERGDPEVLRYVALFLRLRSGMMQEPFGEKCGVDQANVCRYELGKVAPSEETLRRMAGVASVPWHVVVSLIRVYTAANSAIGREAASGDPAGAFSIDQDIVDSIDLAVSAYLIEEDAAETEASVLAAERREAEQVVAALVDLPPGHGRRLLSLSLRASRSWAVADELCHASARAASHKVEEALELAELALYVARRVPGVAERARTEGDCTAFLANVLRVATEFDEADATFARTWELWRLGEAAAYLPLAKWRLLDLEASLRSEQHRFGEALSLLDQALAACDGGDLAVARLLTKKAHVLHQAGDHVAALAALAEAAPAVEASGDRELLLRLRFNSAANLADLERYAETEVLLPEVRELAIELGQELGLYRVVWLQAKLAAGQGKTEEAIAGLQQVSRDFAARQLPYEAALSSLDLAVLWLGQGRASEVRQLALAMAWIFNAKGIAREGLAALSLFCEAARRETATVEMAKQVMAEVEKAQTSASFR